MLHAWGASRSEVPQWCVPLILATPNMKTQAKQAITGKKMSEELLKQRADLAGTFDAATSKASEAKAEADKASERIEIFDASHPQIMRAVNKAAGDRKREVRAAEIAEAAPAEGEDA